MGYRAALPEYLSTSPSHDLIEEKDSTSMRSVLTAIAVCLILMGGATAAAPHPAAAAYNPGQVINAIYPGLRPRTPVHAGHRGARRSAARLSAPAVQDSTPATVEMLALINAERAQAGAGPLHVDATLNAVAQARSQDMIARHYFSHHIPGGGMVFDLLNRDHVAYEMAGENIALNTYID